MSRKVHFIVSFASSSCLGGSPVPKFSISITVSLRGSGRPDMVYLRSIAAVSGSGGIGFNQELPWPPEKGDMKLFRKMTASGRNAIVMGKNTWLSIPETRRPLTGRLNIIVSSTLDPGAASGADVVPSLYEAQRVASEQNMDTLWVIGGSRLYTEALRSPDHDGILLTEMHEDYTCNVFFPEFRNDYRPLDPPISTTDHYTTRWYVKETCDTSTLQKPTQ